VIDYTTKPRSRFVAYHGKLVVPDGWDALDVRATLTRVGEYVGREADTRVWEPALRKHPNPAGLLARLREFHGGDLPGDLETLVLAGGGLTPAHAVDAVILRLPPEVAPALRRDRVAGPLLRRTLGPDECVVARADLPVLRARLQALGVGWEGVGG
jgi:hypothetical protein